MLGTAISSVEMVLFAAFLVTAAVFFGSWRYANRAYTQVRSDASLPRAQALRGGRWSGGSDRAFRRLQTAFIALGMTSIFVMLACALGIVALMIAG